MLNDASPLRVSRLSNRLEADSARSTMSRLLPIAKLFLKLGTIGFGGPATHLALMEEEVVERRGWLSRDQFVDLIGATNLIPGPNSTEMACHVGFVRAGFWGLLVGGVSFILPAAMITTAFAWWYVRYGQQPQVAPLIAGIKPAVLAIVFSAGWRLGRQVITGWLVGVLAAAVGCASICDVPEITALLAGGLVGMLALVWRPRREAGRTRGGGGKRFGGVLLGAGLAGSAGVAQAGLAAPVVVAGAAASQGATLAALGWFFLKVGAVLYGTGYVLIAYLQGDLVGRYGWLTDAQLLDAVAAGQLTPGPIVSTATFIGYVVMYGQGGWPQGLAGAALATVAVFLPSFIFVAITNPLIPKLRKSRWMGAFLDAINAASMGLMAAVTIKLACGLFFPQGSVRSPHWPSLLIAAVATGVALRWKTNAIWLVLGGAAAGLVFHWLL
jgi:chromate transporter